MWNAPDVVPSVTYADLPRAIEWLERVFGFREREEARLTWPGGGMTWFEVGNGLFNVSTRDEAWGRREGAGPAGFVMKVHVEDVDGHFARAGPGAPRSSWSPRTVSGAAASIARWTMRDTSGRSRRTAATWPRIAGIRRPA
jgi:hypothetical protein